MNPVFGLTHSTPFASNDCATLSSHDESSHIPLYSIRLFTVDLGPPNSLSLASLDNFSNFSLDMVGFGIIPERRFSERVSANFFTLSSVSFVNPLFQAM